LQFTLPTDIPDGYISYLVFKSGATPTALSYPDGIKWSGGSISDGEFVPEENTIYNIAFWYDGFYINGIVRGVAE